MSFYHGEKAAEATAFLPNIELLLLNGIVLYKKIRLIILSILL